MPYLSVLGHFTWQVDSIVPNSFWRIEHGVEDN